MWLVTYAFAGVAPEVMGRGSHPTDRQGLAKAGLTIDDIDVFEINEAFAVQVLAFLDHYGIDQNPRPRQPVMAAPSSSGIRSRLPVCG